MEIDGQYPDAGSGARNEPDNVVRGRFRRDPVKTRVVVETSDQNGRVVSREEVDVVRPTAPVRQHEQLVRMVTSQMPDARITRAADGQVKFLCRGYVVRSFYDDVAVPELV